MSFKNFCWKNEKTDTNENDFENIWNKRINQEMKAIGHIKFIMVQPNGLHPLPLLTKELKTFTIISLSLRIGPLTSN